MSDFVQEPARCIGCDVGKATIAVFDSAAGRGHSMAQRSRRDRGVCCALAPKTLVICEATGGFEAALLLALTAAGHMAHRADPRRVKAFIRSPGTRGKSDAIDARAGAIWPGTPRDAGALAAGRGGSRPAARPGHGPTRPGFGAYRVAQPRRRTGGPRAGTFMAPVIAAIATQLAAIDAEFARVIAASATLAPRMAKLCAIPGGRRDEAAAGADAGTGPPRPAGGGVARGAGAAPAAERDARRLPANAGRSAGGETHAVHGGDVGGTASSHAWPVSSAPVGSGKKPIVALVAVMRKLVVLCNAVLREATA